MGILGFICACYVIYRLIKEKIDDSRTYPGTYDWEASRKDCVKCTCGELSKKELERREKSGYYYK